MCACVIPAVPHETPPHHRGHSEMTVIARNYHNLILPSLTLCISLSCIHSPSTPHCAVSQKVRGASCSPLERWMCLLTSESALQSKGEQLHTIVSYTLTLCWISNSTPVVGAAPPSYTAEVVSPSHIIHTMYQPHPLIQLSWSAPPTYHAMYQAHPYLNCTYTRPAPPPQCNSNQPHPFIIFYLAPIYY